MSAKVTAVFEADDKQLSNTLLNINRKLLAFSHSIAKLEVGSVKGGRTEFPQGIKHFTAALDQGKRLLELFNNTGIAINDLAALRSISSPPVSNGFDGFKGFGKSANGATGIVWLPLHATIREDGDNRSLYRIPKGCHALAKRETGALALRLNNINQSLPRERSGDIMPHSGDEFTQASGREVAEKSF